MKWERHETRKKAETETRKVKKKVEVSFFPTSYFSAFCLG
jgi:hypothetical protein